MMSLFSTDNSLYAFYKALACMSSCQPVCMYFCQLSCMYSRRLFCISSSLSAFFPAAYQLATVALNIWSQISLHICVTSSSCTDARLWVVS